jgi:predicted nucleotidyltransferase
LVLGFCAKFKDQNQKPKTKNLIIMKHHFEAFLEDVKATHGRNLAAVILYGSAAAGDFVPQRSDYNLLIALQRITPKDLRNAHACMREWAKMGHPVPVYFTLSELQNAADVFPIEFHNMERARKVLYGTDVLANIKISDEFLRHQTEYELRSKLIRLRRAYIPASGSVEGLVNLMAESLSSFAAIFRAVLLIYGINPPPVTKHEIVALTAEKLNISGSSFEKIFNIRENNFDRTLNEVSANELFTEYMEQIESVIAAVDKIGKS